MNNPIEINAFKHYLEIDNVRTEILEPIGFDASNFVCEQDKDGYGRDIFYGNSEIDLEFHKEYGINLLPTGLDLLLEQENLNGSESDVNYILTKNNVDFNIGQLDFAGAITDYESYFKCKIIQNNEQAKIKKRSKVKIDAFAIKDLDDNTITPIETKSILLKAKPIDVLSRWKDYSYSQDIDRSGFALTYFPLVGNLVKYNIKNSYVPFNYYAVTFGMTIEEIIELQNNTRIIVATEQLTNVKVKIRNLSASISGDYTNTISLVVYYGSGFSSSDENTTLVILEPAINEAMFLSNKNYDIDIPVLSPGQHIQIAFQVRNFYPKLQQMDYM